MANVNTDNINTRTDINRLPGFDKSFNGPIHYFQRLFLIPFTMALGNITMDNVSLLDTWNGVDPGAPGVAGNGHREDVLYRLTFPKTIRASRGSLL